MNKFKPGDRVRFTEDLLKEFAEYARSMDIIGEVERMEGGVVILKRAPRIGMPGAPGQSQVTSRWMAKFVRLAEPEKNEYGECTP